MYRLSRTICYRITNDYTAGQNLAVFFVERQFCESNLKYLKIHTFQWINSMYDVNMI